MSEAFLKAVRDAPAGSTILWDETDTVVKVIESGEQTAGSETETMTENDVDVTEKVEQTETGYRMTISSKRGTGTRDHDEVSITAKTETLDKLMSQRSAIRTAVTVELNQLRLNQPDNEDEE